MQKIKRRRIRIIEIITGLIILITAFSFIASILLDFNFVTPYSTLSEDLTYLFDQYNSQRISSYSWIVTSVLTLISAPLYLLIFRRRLRVLQYIAVVFLLVAAAGFFVLGYLGLEFSESVGLALSAGEVLPENVEHLKLLADFREEQLYKVWASSSLGAFVFLIGFSKIKVRLFPIVSSIFFLSGGPLLIFFNWYDRDHFIRTAAMAMIAAGMILFCMKLIYSGLSPRISSSKS